MGRHALLIGIFEFADQRLTRLNSPINDVLRLQRILEDKSRGGFDSVELALNESFLALRDRLSQFFDRRARDAGGATDRSDARPVSLFCGRHRPQCVLCARQAAD